MSKKVILVCDRHGGEHPAVTSVWLKTAGMSRIIRVDVCEDAYNLIVGAGSNGHHTFSAKASPAVAPPKAASPNGRRRGVGATPGSDTAKLLKAMQTFLQHTKRRFTLDDVMHALAGTAGLKKTAKAPRVGPILRALIKDGVVERHGTFGVYGPKGAPAPAKPGTPAETATLIAKEVRAHPGIRVAYLPGLLDLEAPVVKRTIAKLVEMGLVKTKGMKSASRAYPVTKT